MKSILVSIVAAVLVVGCGESSVSKNAAAASCTSQLTQIDGVKKMWATYEKRADGDTPSETQVGEYLKDGVPSCPRGGAYTIGAVGNQASCSIHGTAPPPSPSKLKGQPLYGHGSKYFTEEELQH